MKLEKVLISISLIFLLLVILLLGYLFIRNSFQSSNNVVDRVVEQKNPVEEGKILNLDRQKTIENPTEEDILNLIKDLKNQNKELEIE